MYSPSLSEFLDLSSQGNLIPVSTELLADTETPLTAYLKLTQGESANAFLLESIEGGEQLGRYSFIGFNPRLVISVKEGRLTIQKGNSCKEVKAPADPLQAVEEEMAQYKAVVMPKLPRFTGGMVGYIGFEYISHIEPVPRPAKDDLRLPLMHFMLADSLVIFDRVRQVIQIVANAHIMGDPRTAYDSAVQRIRQIQNALSQSISSPPVILPRELPSLDFKSNISKETFLNMVSTCKRYIRQGDVFQIVPSQRFAVPLQATPLELYRALRTINPSPYMFLMQMPGFSLVGSSPEIHVRCEEGMAEIHPIAGTRPRGNSPEEDERFEKELLKDEKERAEHLMLVDLARNDLGRVCEFESVSVPQFMTIERYSHVMHIVSRVVGKIQKNRTPFDLMRATFPAGTLSGAPKIRATQILSELEKNDRGPYGGALGYFSFNGNLDTCITIRTIIAKDGMAYVQAGAGIVDDSVPENEYQETVNKAKGMIKAVALANSFAGKR